MALVLSFKGVVFNYLLTKHFTKDTRDAIRNIKKNVPIATSITTAVEAISNAIAESTNADKIVPNEPASKHFILLRKHFSKLQHKLSQELITESIKI